MQDGNLKTPCNISYMLKHLITANTSDPLSQTSRDYSDYQQYFSGTAAAGQINYLERKPTTAGRFDVTVGGVAKTDGIDYTLNRTTMTITWTGTTPASGSDNINVVYQALKQWCYDDHPFLEAGNFPRITVDILNEDYKTPGIGIFHNYNSGIGMYVEDLVKVVVRNRKSNEYYSYGGIHYKNFDLINAISENIVNYILSNREVMVWKFYDWEVVRTERIKTEESDGIFRKDITLKVKYFDKAP